MGCSSSKRVEAAIDVYRPPPSSFAVFNINAVEEPWLKAMEAAHEQHELDDQKQSTHIVPSQIIDKLNAIEDAPRTWEEVSKALEDIKPSLHKIPPTTTDEQPPKTKAEQPPPPSPLQNYNNEQPPPPRKNFSFHTLEEFDSKRSPKPNNQLKKSESMQELKKPLPSINPKKKGIISATGPDSGPESKPAPTLPDGSKPKPVKDNIFILRDKQEREKEGKPAAVNYFFDPLSEFPEKCPPDGADSVVIYTTSLGGVRRTFEECNKIRSILESHQVVFDERDVSLHSKFLKELREILEEDGAGGWSVPRMFVKGRYIGGAEEVMGLNETGKLRRILNRARIERGVGRLGCDGCGGARFVPCLHCGGSCKIVVGDVKERCLKCNENGLILCPLCA